MFQTVNKFGRFLYWVRFAIPLLLIGLGCATRQPVKTTPEMPGMNFRAVYLPQECWIDPVPDSIKIRMSVFIHAARQARYNSVILDLRGTNETMDVLDSSRQNNEVRQLNPVRWAIDHAHQQELKVMISLDLLGPGSIEYGLDPTLSSMPDIKNLPRPNNSWYLDGNHREFLDPAHPEVKTLLKKMIRMIAMQYDLDGLILDFSGFADLPEEFSTADENSPLKGLIKDLVAEAAMVNRHLIMGAGLQDGWLRDHPEMNQWAKNGPVDLLIPVVKNIQEQPESRIISGWIDGFVFFPGKICDKLTGNLSNDYQGNTEPEKFQAFPVKIDPKPAFSLDISRLLGERKSGKSIGIQSEDQMKITDSEGRIGFILEEKPDTLKILLHGATLKLSTAFWKPPFDYAIRENGEAFRKMPWLEFRDMPDPVTNEPEFHLLCKTSWPATAWINDDTVKVYKTGIFFDKINLKEGVNRVRAGIAVDKSIPVTYTREFIYVKTDNTRPIVPLWIDEKSVSPAMNMVLTPKDRVHIRFSGSKGQEGRIRVRPDNIVISCSRRDFDDYSVYEAEFPVKEWKRKRPHTISLILQSAVENKNIPRLEFNTGTEISVMESSGFPWLRTIRNHTRLTYNLGPVRLGGPIRAELQEGIIMQSSGIFGDFYRIFLNDEEEGFVNMENVEVMPATYSQEPYYITSLSCGPSESGDILSIPYLKSIPYALYPEPGKKMIRIRLYGAKTSSTWITHLQGRKVIDQVTWSQVTPETYEIQIHLNTSKTWGYDLRQEGNLLIFHMKYPPDYVLAFEKPLKGLKIAVEAGHGGNSYGAMGLSGLLEKDVNLDLARRFGKICRSLGAEIIQVRNSDTTMSLIDKRDIAIHSEADMLICIHANAAGTSRGYLGVSGTSTYYHNPFWAELAERMYDHLLELDLSEFGVVGSFNYTVIRVTRMPAILVEQAFMTHAEDEEKLASPEFRQTMAEKMYNGIIDFLTYMKKE